MRTANGSNQQTRGEPDWTLAPAEPEGGLVRLHVVVDRSADDPVRPFLTVGETPDAVGFLGALADGRSVPVEWVSIWLAKAPIPTLGGDELDGPSSSVEIERRWSAAWKAWDSAREGSCAILPAEARASAPVMLLSRSGRAPRPLAAGRDPTPLELCTDDALLEANDLPAYSRSTFRFLVSRPAHGNPRFFWLSGGDAAPGISTNAADLVPDPDEWILFNAGAGLLGAGPMRVTPYRAVSFTDLASMLHGESPRPAVSRGVAPTSASRLLGAWSEATSVRTRPVDAGRLFGGLDRAHLRHLEANYLRVRAVADMIAAVRQATDLGGQPLFNVAPESFAAEIGTLTEGLPFLWQTQVRLARPGVARAFTVEADPPLRLFNRPASAGLESLVPTEPAVAFVAEALLLDVADAGAGAVTLKLQLVPRQPVVISETDLLRLFLRLGNQQFPILARPTKAMMGRQPFEARSMPFTPPADRPMRAGAQVSLMVETIPIEGSPHDLYALFVLACRMLLAGGHPTAPHAAGDAEEAATIAALRNAVGADDTREAPETGPLFDRAADFAPELRPAPLVANDGSPDSWPEGISTELWSDVLRAIASMRPGWPKCPCRNLAHFDPEAPGRVFDAPLAAFEVLARRLRGAILGERAIDAEIRAVALEMAARRRDRAQAAR